jgi:hypothetical protein
MGLKRQFCMVVGGLWLGISGCQQPLQVDVHPTPLPVQLAATTKPVEIHVAPIEFMDQSQKVRVEPTTQPFLVKMDTTQPVSFDKILDDHTLELLAAVLGLSAYLRATSGEIVKAQKRRISEYVWYTRAIDKRQQVEFDGIWYRPDELNPFRDKIPGKLRTLAARYLLTVLGEAILIYLSILLVFRVAGNAEGLNPGIRWLVIITPFYLAFMHAVLWFKSIFFEKWALFVNHSNHDGVIPLKPGTGRD